MTRFDTVLVANRGEIAVRVIKAVRAAGLRSVAVYSDVDRSAPHVSLADVAVRIGPAPARQSYLDIDALLDAAKRTSCGAVHPGYGFLSERAEFARAVTAAGLVFIGPPGDVMEAMGRKDSARAIAVAAGVPVVPAASDLATRAADLDAIAREVGFPLLVKAAAGGGGKGMRIVASRARLDDDVAAARREALAAFGDESMIFERYVEHGRHIEVQIIADEHGQVLHLLDRDCSVQRRHQKVVEEAPAPTISAAVRARLASAATQLARSVGYVGAGTVEFLVAGDEAYFLEMNTRLQVEHPVTELVTGIDLVALQLAVAQGEPLPFTQDEVTASGHAIEARVYAEDAAGGFLPQAGTARLVHWPAGARVDEALQSGQVVGSDYDPLLGKVVASGPTRESARRALVAALDDTAIVGLTTNTGFLRWLVDSEAYRDAAIDTAWLDRTPIPAPTPPGPAWCLAAWAVASPPRQASSDPFGCGDGWRLGAPAAGVPVTLALPGAEPVRRDLLVERVSADGGTGAITDTVRAGPDADAGAVTPTRIRARSLGWDAERLRLELDGVVESGRVLIDHFQVSVAYHGQTYVFDRHDAFGSLHHADPVDGSVSAPMPGTVLTVDVAVGDEVLDASRLGVLEAMKMELTLNAPFAGTVAEVLVRAGQQVKLGDPLFVVAAEGDGAVEESPSVQGGGQ